MGTVYADVTLKNAIDVGDVQRGHRTEREVRAVKVRALVDTGCGTLAINEQIRDQLGLATEGLRGGTLADGTKKVYQMTEPVKIYWKNRDAVCRAIVVPGADTVLLGAIPLEDMDLIVNPTRRELIGAHGDEVLCLLK
ncbi:MAG: aspartyl protease family protein [Spirochaetales bacterium]|nr:aspartyl protease family protein [Spirochaetales bacterium]